MRALFTLFTLSLLTLAVLSPARAQSQDSPPLPAPLEALSQEGAQVRYLGKTGTLDGWIAIQGGQEQYFYATEDREFILLGLLFDKEGKMVTLQQVQALQKEGGAVLDVLKATPDAAAAQEAAAAEGTDRAFKTPAEQMFSDIEASNFVTLGKTEAPVIYTFMDPQCPYCHAMMDDLKAAYIDNGLVQVRMIPVGFKEDTKAQAALLLAIADPAERWFKHLAGDAAALPVTPGINAQGVEKNLSIMQSWKMNVTPLSVYRAKNGEVKILQGRPRDLQALVNDIKG